MRPKNPLKQVRSGKGGLKSVKQPLATDSGKTVSDAVSKSMRSNRSIGTLPEKSLARMLWNAGLRGYRKNDRRIPGKPDIYFPRLRLAVLLNGCFWHRCPYCKPAMPKTNVEFWSQKFTGNKKRDRRQYRLRYDIGIRSLVVWECSLKKGPYRVLQKVQKAILEQEAKING